MTRPASQSFAIPIRDPSLPGGIPGYLAGCTRRFSFHWVGVRYPAGARGGMEHCTPGNADRGAQFHSRVLPTPRRGDRQPGATLPRRAAAFARWGQKRAKDLTNYFSHRTPVVLLLNHGVMVNEEEFSREKNRFAGAKNE